MGRITGPHGVQGWVRIYSYTDPVEKIFSYDPWHLAETEMVSVEASRIQGKRLIARLEGIEDRDQAAALVDREIWVDRDQLEQLAEGEFYWHQLEGLKVVSEAGEVFGEVTHLMETGANDVLVVDATTDSIDDRQRLIPWVDNEVVSRVDLEEQRIVVNWDPDY
ncbi:MAG: ribosome maturation factor RimM [Pseudomonadales bacterium]|nr:ribosome maturation factor RimM [Pseudomonadales bacterium]